MINKIVLLAGFLFLSIGLTSQTTVTGYIYVDENGNGEKEKPEKGLPNVPVSNGVEVTVTDEEGLYELPVGDDNIIFVIKPSGYKTPVDENNLPRFYYLYKPE